MSMSVKMKESHKQMMEYGEKLTAMDFGKESVRILHEDGSFYFLPHAILVDAVDYIWVFCEHCPELIFCKGDLLEWGLYVKKTIIE